MDFSHHPVATATIANATRHGCACQVHPDGTLEIVGPDGDRILRTSLAPVSPDPAEPQTQIMIMEFEQAIIARDRSVIGEGAYGMTDGRIERIAGLKVSRSPEGEVSVKFELSDEEIRRITGRDGLASNGDQPPPEVVEALMNQMMERVAGTEQVLWMDVTLPKEEADPAWDALADVISRAADDLGMECVRTAVDEVAVVLVPGLSQGDQKSGVRLNLASMATDTRLDPSHPVFQMALRAQLENSRADLIAAQGIAPDDPRLAITPHDQSVGGTTGAGASAPQEIPHHTDTGATMYADHPLVLVVRERAAGAGLGADVDAEGTLTIATPEGEVIISLSIAGLPEDPANRTHQIMALELGKVIDTRDASVMGNTAYGVRHDGTVEEIGGASVSGEGDDATISFSLGNVLGETNAVDDPSVRGIDPGADRMADLMAMEADRLEGVTIARTAVDEVAVMDADGVVCATFAVASYAASGADLDDPWIGREIRSWLCEQAGISDELPEGEVSWAVDTGENTTVIDPQAMLESMGLGDIRIRPNDPVERLFQYLEEVAEDNGLRAVMTDAGNAALLDDSGEQVLTANLESMSEKGLADDRDYFRLQIQDALHRRQPMTERADDGWLTAHLRRDGQDFYEGAALVERFSSAGMDFALIPHYENAMSLHHLLPHMVEEMGGEEAVRQRLLADRERAEFIIQGVDQVSAPDGTQALMLVGDNIATMLVHPGLHRTLVEAIDIGPDELAAPDDPIGPMMAFAPSTTIIGFFPTAKINDMLPQIKQWAEGVSPAGEPLLYGCLLRNYPDEPWGRIIDRTR